MAVKASSGRGGAEATMASRRIEERRVVQAVNFVSDEDAEGVHAAVRS